MNNNEIKALKYVLIVSYLFCMIVTVYSTLVYRKF